jgi:hypothetical protein
LAKSLPRLGPTSNRRLIQEFAIYRSFTVKADGTCATSTVFVPPSGKEATRDVSATHTKEGSKLTMQWQGAGMTTGTIEGNTFTMDNEGMVFVYKK